MTDYQISGEHPPANAAAQNEPGRARKARREGIGAGRSGRGALIAVLAPLAISAAATFATAAAASLILYKSRPESEIMDFGAGNDWFNAQVIFAISALIFTPAIIVHAIGIMAVFYMLRHVHPLSGGQAAMHGWIKALFIIISAGIPLLLLWLAPVLISLEPPPAPFLVAFTLAPLIPCIFLGNYLLAERRRRAKLLFGAVAAQRRSRSRRSIIALAALAGALIIILAGLMLAEAYQMMDQPSGLAGSSIIVLALAGPHFSVAILLPLALMASDAYYHRRQRLGRGPDSRLALALAGSLALAFLLIIAGVVAAAILTPSYW